MNDVRSKTLITADELARLLGGHKTIVLLDVIDEQGSSPEDRPKIPGALSVHLATDFSGKPTPTAGRRPLPDLGDLQSKARAWGICSDSIVVVYDNSGGALASRAWWTLRWAGLSNVRLLDGGYGAWIATKRPTSNHLARRAACAGDVALTLGCMPTVNAEEAAVSREAIQIAGCTTAGSLCRRSWQTGTGHIPGAIYAAAGDNIAEGKFKPNDALRARLLRLGADGSTRSAFIVVAVIRRRTQSRPCPHRALARALCRLVVCVERRSVSPGGNGY